MPADRKNRRILALCALFSSLACSASWAHHSIGGEFINGEEVTVTGTVTEFRLINPHTYIVIGVSDGASSSQDWTLTYGPATKLIRGMGWTPETLKIGDSVTATGRPAREGLGMYLSWLAKADGTVLLTELIE